MLKQMPEQILIRAVGNWNPRVFTPAWIKRHLIETESTAIDMLFNPEEIEIGYDINGIKIFPKSSELLLLLEGTEGVAKEALLLSLNKMLLRILELLPQTPIKAIGINMNYRLDSSSQAAIVAWYNSNQLTYDGLSLSGLTLSKSESNYTLNIKFSRNEDKIIVNMNYHFEKEIDPDQNLISNLLENSGGYLL